jgi:NADH-quinone oxidoreductase subunit L
MKLLWLIPALPLIGFLIIGLANKRLSGNAAGSLATLTVSGSFILSLYYFFGLVSGSYASVTEDYFKWIPVAKFSVSFGFLLDQLSGVMLLVITGVGSLIHLYSIGYMHHDEDAPRYFSYLNLFVFFMLLLVMGSGYLLLFVGWEGVGLCSYLLIGFWFKNSNYNAAANKAFIMNRIGDLGFLLGMFLMLQTFGSLQFSEVFGAARSMPFDQPEITAIVLLLFIGAAGKSAQIPLYIWLPDAMAGPTPVSALIHAATMVTAGIYMVVRSNALYFMAPFASEIIAVVGLATALVAAIIGLKQTDIKKVLAYSTVSQLGFMVVALGVGAYTTALFHVVTHAFFKALLFLGAGSVIHAMAGEQDIRRMGGLKKALPVTHATFLIGTLAIAGAPPFAGFFSKDEILAHTWMHNPLMFSVLVICSLITAVYMFRLYFLTFHGDFRGTGHQKEHLHESPASMTVPLIVLAGLSIIGGFIGLPEAFYAPHWLNNFMEPVTGYANAYSHGHPSHAFEYVLMASLTIALVVIIMVMHHRYVKKGHLPANESQLSGWERLVSNKFYVDELYAKLFTRPMDVLSSFSYEWIEKGFIDRMVNGLGSVTRGAGSVLRYIQTGYLATYLLLMVIAIIFVVVLKLAF